MSSSVTRKPFYAIVCGASLLLILAACTRRPTAPGTWSVRNNQPARLADYKGKVVVLDFYATWCVPCRAETPRLVQLQKDYGASGLQVVGLNVGGDDDRQQVPVFAKEFGIEYPLGFPDDNLVAEYLTDNQDIPQAFVFDRNGELIKRFVGYSPASGAELERIVKGALAAGPVAKQNQ
jgi:thiol-disulfide isomerase/thioredoxin